MGSEVGENKGDVGMGKPSVIEMDTHSMFSHVLYVIPCFALPLIFLNGCPTMPWCLHLSLNVFLVFLLLHDSKTCTPIFISPSSCLPLFKPFLVFFSCPLFSLYVSKSQLAEWL